jgi:hypothetical protein
VGTAGTYQTVVTDADGRVISGYSLTSSVVVNALGYTPLAASLAQPSLTIIGDVSGSGMGTLSLTLATVAIPGTYTKVVSDYAGRVIGGTSISSTDVVNALGYLPMGGALNYAVAPAFNDVTIPSPQNFAVGPSVTLGVGVWMIMCSLTVQSPLNQLSNLTAQLTNGSTVYTSAQQTQPGNATLPNFSNLSLTTVIPLSATTVIKGGVESQYGGAVIIGETSSLTALQVG